MADSGFPRTFAVATEFISKFGCNNQTCTNKSIGSCATEEILPFFSVGSCKHVFCETCSEKIKEKRQCSVCGTGTFPKDIRPHRQINELVVLVRKLVDLLTEDTMGELIESSQSLNIMELPKIRNDAPALQNTKSPDSSFKVPFPAPEQSRSLEKANVKKSILNNKSKHQGPTVASTRSRSFPSKSAHSNAPEEPAPKKARHSKETQRRQSKTSANSSSESTPQTFSKRQSSSEKTKEIDENGLEDLFDKVRCSRNRSGSSISNTSLRSRRDSLKRNKQGETPLVVAARSGKMEAVKEILADETVEMILNVQDHNGYTALHEAAHGGYTDIVEVLLQHGALMDVPATEDFITPLHDAISEGNEDIVRLLIMSGADIALRDIHGNSAIDLAETEKMKKIIRYSKRRKLILNPDTSVSISSGVLVPKFCCSAVDKKDPELLKFGLKYVLWLEKDLPEDATHLIVPELSQRKRSFKCLLAMLKGLWIVDFSFVKDALVTGKLPEKPEHYEVETITETENPKTDGGPKRARINKAMLRPGLFVGCNFYLCSKDFSVPLPTRNEMVQLIQAAGGKVLKREPTAQSLEKEFNTVPIHAENGSEVMKYSVFYVYVPGDTLYEKAKKVDSKVIAKVSATWVLDSISQFRILTPY